MKKTARTWLEVAAVFMFLLLILGLFTIELHAERRFAIYSIQRELRAGMTLGEVQEVISRYSVPYLHPLTRNDKLILRVDTGLLRARILTITFRNGMLSSARIYGEDGPNQTFRDAPPDIVPNA